MCDEGDEVRCDVKRWSCGDVGIVYDGEWCVSVVSGNLSLPQIIRLLYIYIYIYIYIYKSMSLSACGCVRNVGNVEYHTTLPHL